MDADQQDDWRVHYQAALLEADPQKLPERIERAYSAVQIRLNTHRNANSAEYQDLSDALANLRVLQREIASTKDAPKTGDASTRLTSP